MTQTVCLNDTTVKFEIWDTAGYASTSALLLLPRALILHLAGKNDITLSRQCITEVPKVRLNCPTLRFSPFFTPGLSRAAAIVVYDITSHESFERAKQWIKELQRNGNPDIVIALAGNKLDLADKRNVATQEAQEYAEENGILFSETSAKTAANVNELFVAIGTP